MNSAMEIYMYFGSHCEGGDYNNLHKINIKLNAQHTSISELPKP